MLFFCTNRCTTPANYYGRNVITSETSSCFPLGLHNTNDRRKPTEAAETAPADLPCHVGNLHFVIKTTPSKSRVTEN